MKFNYIIAAVAFIVTLALDFYICHTLDRRLGDNKRKKVVKAYKYCAALTYLVLACAILIPRSSGSNSVVVTDMWLIFGFGTTLIARLIYCIFDWMSLIPRHFNLSLGRIMSATGIAVATIAFFATWWGALINRNRISVTRADIVSSQWPAEFDGFTIAQLSDLHVGTWGSDTTFLSRLVERTNALHPDMIVFTGDIVNRESSEFELMTSTFSRLNAPYGVFAIMGNHDYGDYRSWETEELHMNDRKNLHHLYDATGHKLLLNETVFIRKGNDSIALIGVENIGEPPFSVYGDLNIAYPTRADSVPKILLSHNPAHWTTDIENNPDENIQLTLAGHTHAMQIQIGGHTPASWRYPTSWGLYTDSLGRYLYVNRGAGTVGMPMRIGATPEITLLTLRTTAR